jgi:hypothetical protein
MSSKWVNVRRSSLLEILISGWQNAFSAMLVGREMDRTDVQSCSIVSAGYIQASKTLQIEYLSGHLYEVRDVPAALYTHLIKDENFDRVFYGQILNKYSIERVGRLWPVSGW